MRIHLISIATQTLATNEAMPISQFSCVYGRLVETIAKSTDLVNSFPSNPCSDPHNPYNT